MTSDGDFLAYGPQGLSVVETALAEPTVTEYPWSAEQFAIISQRGFYSVVLDEPSKTIIVGGANEVHLLRYGEDRVVTELVTLNEPGLYGNFSTVVGGQLFYPTPANGTNLRVVGLNGLRVESTLSVPTPTDGWGEERFSSEHFTLSFEVPPGYEVTESLDRIHVSEGPFEEYAIGGNNAILTLARYTDTYPKERAVSDVRETMRDISDLQIQIDDEAFPLITGTDYGSLEGSSAGDVFYVVFPKSLLFSIGDTFTAQQILRTMKFSK
jgi:hypothetical protein